MNEDQTHRVGLRGIKAFQVESVRITTNLKRPFPTDALRTLIEMRLRTASIPVVDTTESAHLTNAAIIQPIFTINTIHVETVQGPMTICGMNFFFGVFDRVTIERSGWTGWKDLHREFHEVLRDNPARREHEEHPHHHDG